MNDHASSVRHEPGEPRSGFLARWHQTPLYYRIIGALILGVLVAIILSPAAMPAPDVPFRTKYGVSICESLGFPSALILRLLGALAPPLILIAVVQALMNARLEGKRTGKMIRLLILNTVVAICLGLLVANIVQPGRWSKLVPKAEKANTQAVDAQFQRTLDVLAYHGYVTDQKETATAAVIGHRLVAARETRGLSTEEAAAKSGVPMTDLTAMESGKMPPKEGELADLARIYGVRIASLVTPPRDTLGQFLDNVPRSLIGPLSDNGSVLSVIMIAVAFGLALRRSADKPVATVAQLIGTAFDSLLVILHWIIDLVPIGVFGIVGSIVGRNGFGDFKALGMFIVSVILALALQAVYYLTRIRFGSWVSVPTVLAGTRDAVVMAFSTASSTATMPVTYSCLRDNVGLREESASMGALVGSNFNNDGTALYEAMSALFIAQMLGMHLDLAQQLLVVLTSIIASVGAAGIPEAGLVTMTLVFTAVGLPTPFIALLLTVDWFLDRCRTAVNVMGDINVSCLLDGKDRSPSADAERPREETPSVVPA
jgi:Na+/H+-dicarboxylate symporter